MEGQRTAAEVNMARIEVPPHLRDSRGTLIHGDLYWVDVKLTDGRVFRGLASQGEFITGMFNAIEGAFECDLPFTTADIKKVRPHSVLPFWW